MTRSAPPRVAIIGAGPVGLEAAAYAAALQLPVCVYDAGPVAGNVERWGFTRLFTPFGWNHTPLGRSLILQDGPRRALPADADHLTGREFREHYLLPLAQCQTLRPVVQPDARVIAVTRDGWRKSDPAAGKLPPFRLLVRDAKGERIDPADVVLDCSGVFHRPNFAGDGGVPACGELACRQHLVTGVDDVLGVKKSQYAGQTTVVIGSGHSAATVVTDLVTLAEEHQSTWVVWLTRGPRTAPVPRVSGDPLKERDRLAARANHLAGRGDGNLEAHAHAQVDEVAFLGPDKGFRVIARVAGKSQEWEAERVVAAVGHRPDLSLTSELRVDEPAGDIETGEPGYFVLGAKSAGRGPGFLLRDGFDQVRRAFAAVAGKPGLDLYRARAA